MAFGPSRKISSSDKNHSRKRIKLYTESFSNLDDCINSNYNFESMRSRLVSHHNKNNTENFSESDDLVPITFGLIVSKFDSKNSSQNVNISSKHGSNISTTNKKINSTKKPVRILLDSGASASIIHKDFVTVRDYSKSNNTQLWTT